MAALPATPVARDGAQSAHYRSRVAGLSPATIVWDFVQPARRRSCVAGVPPTAIVRGAFQLTSCGRRPCSSCRSGLVSISPSSGLSGQRPATAIVPPLQSADCWNRKAGLPRTIGVGVQLRPARRRSCAASLPRTTEFGAQLQPAHRRSCVAGLPAKAVARVFLQPVHHRGRVVSVPPASMCGFAFCLGGTPGALDPPRSVLSLT